MLEKNKVKDAKNVLIYDEKLGDNAIQLNFISFKYFGSDSNIFNNLSLTIQKNSHTVITGIMVQENQHF